MTMDHSIPPVITSLSWGLSEAFGIYAALQAGMQGGAIDELPFASFLSAISKEELPNGKSDDNVFIGIESQWLRMMLKSFQTRQLKFSYLQLRKERVSTKCDIQQLGNECLSVMKPPNCTKLMLFGLINSQDMEDRDVKNVAVHRSYCILERTIDKCTTESRPPNLLKNLKELTGDEVTNRKALQLCLNIIDNTSDAVLSCEKVNYRDKRIIMRARKLIEILSKRSKVLQDAVADSDFLRDVDISPANAYRLNTEFLLYEEGGFDIDTMNEVLDHITSRVPAILERLGVKQVEIDGVPYKIPDLVHAFIICLGIMRAMIMSDYIYYGGAVVVVGRNVDVAHKLMDDVSKVPDYSPQFPFKPTAKSRLIDKRVRSSYVFYYLLFDAILSTSIMLLSGLGPIISMFVARQLSVRYRESTMRMGTSMSWAVSRVMLFNTGEATDDWMACIIPRKCTLNQFTLLSMFSSFGPPLLWIFYHPPASCISRSGWLICLTNVPFGLLWLLFSNWIEKEKLPENPMVIKQPFDDYTHKPRCNPVYLCALAVIAPLALFSMDLNWVWLYILELAYSLQWLYGEVSSQWMHKGTALFMLGMLGAVRLYELV